MSQSIAYDGDLEYTKKDLVRFYWDFPGGPQGIFLKKTESGRIFYAKSFAYPLFVSIFVKFFNYHGFFIFHSCLLFLILLMGYYFLSSKNNLTISLIYTLTFLFASIAIIYFIWITGEFFNLFLVFSIIFLWVYKLIKENKAQISNNNQHEIKNSFIKNFLISDNSDYLASFLVGIATFSKPPNILLIGPLFIYSFFNKRWMKSIIILLIFSLTVGAFFGVNYLLTSDLNYMGGERKTFLFKFPFEQEGYSFDSLGHLMTSEDYFKKHPINLKIIIYNIFYFFFGRFSGIVWYFFPAFLALLLFLFSREKKLYQWLILATILGEILIYVILMPDNYIGGGGTLGNRYFLNIYPLFFFLPNLTKSKKEIILSWIVAGVLLSQILLNPFSSSSYPATHAKKFPFKIFPVEKTLINTLPTNTNPSAFGINFGYPPNRHRLYFLDDNFHKKQGNGFWTYGDSTSEILLRTYYPIKKIRFKITNNGRLANKAFVKVDGAKKEIILHNKEKKEIDFTTGSGFKFGGSYIYHLKIKSAKGAIPYFENKKSNDRRFLGVFVEIEVVPK
ncbi:MAG: hypothetical protein ACE5WD_11995 [Candidatus Aminicenantia bacterium]